MKLKMTNGREIEVTLEEDAHGLPALKADGLFIASLTNDGRVMLSQVGEEGDRVDGDDSWLQRQEVDGFSPFGLPYVPVTVTEADYKRNE